MPTIQGLVTPEEARAIEEVGYEIEILDHDPRASIYTLENLVNVEVWVDCDIVDLLATDDIEAYLPERRHDELDKH